MKSHYRKKIAEYYERDGETFVIRISTNHFRDLFHKFDRSSSFVKRELDYDFADYLYESALDLDKYSFYIRIDLHAEKKSEELENKVYKGIDNYFEYEMHRVAKRMREIIRKIVIHLLLAISCIFISYYLNQHIREQAFYYILFVESIVIAAWVFMWPLFSDFFYELVDDWKTMQVYKTLIDSQIMFNYIELKR